MGPKPRLFKGAWLLLAAMTMALFGCKPATIQVYQAPKDQPLPHSPDDDPHANVHAHGALGAQRSLTFQLPDGWREKPADRMRVAQIVVPGKDGLEADLSIIPLVGMTAGREDVMNIWREQLRLPLMDKAAAEAAVSVVEVGEGKGDLYDLASTELLVQQQHKMRILAAVREEAGTSWFIKMAGPDDLVREAKPAFLAFLKSLSWGAPASAAAPEMGATPGGGAAGTPHWQPPSHWREQKPPGPMLTAKFLAAGDGRAQAEITVSSLAGDGGGALPNVNRWRGQLLLPPVSAEELAKLGAPVEINGQRIPLYDMEGTLARTGDPARMLVLGVPAGGQTWFYKILGDAALVAREKDAFLQFVRSVKYSHAQ